MYRGGPGFIYRLTVRPIEPSYHVDVLRANVTAYVGRKTTLMAQVHRTGGVHVIEPFKNPDSEIENFRIHEIDGWHAPVMLGRGRAAGCYFGARHSRTQKHDLQGE